MVFFTPSETPSTDPTRECIKTRFDAAMLEPKADLELDELDQADSASDESDSAQGAGRD